MPSKRKIDNFFGGILIYNIHGFIQYSGDGFIQIKPSFVTNFFVPAVFDSFFLNAICRKAFKTREKTQTFCRR